MNDFFITRVQTMAEDLNRNEQDEVELNYYGREGDLNLGNLDSQSHYDDEDDDLIETKEGTDAP